MENTGLKSLNLIQHVPTNIVHRPKKEKDKVKRRKKEKVKKKLLMSKHSKGKADGGKKAGLKYHASWMLCFLIFFPS